MQIQFYKYHGAGNDFILLDNRDERYSQLTEPQIAWLCHRHVGIGADGLMLLNTAAVTDFDMVYFNSDGRPSTMCGNGGRCITAFAHDLGHIDDDTVFTASDGQHEAIRKEDGLIQLSMLPVQQIEEHETYFCLNTGSPHYVHYTDGLADMNVRKEGALIRYSPRFIDEGINVNFVEILEANHLFVRTYERGVEDETLSCGTGVTAAALTYAYGRPGHHHIHVSTPGGKLEVTYDLNEQGQFTHIVLTGPALKVFEGGVNCPDNL